MRHKTRYLFNEVAEFSSTPSVSDGLIYAVRTDANFATESLKQNITAHMIASGSNEAPESIGARVKSTVHSAYRDWGQDILRAMAKSIDYKAYGITDPRRRFLEAHLYNAGDLASDVKAKARRLGIKASGKDVPVLMVSLDGMIDTTAEKGQEIAFSRLFSHCGTSQYDYVARPGTKPIDEQIIDLRDTLAKMKQKHGTDIPFVLLEDNVRQARMLNWFIEKLDSHGVFNHGTLAGISTCFCCASQKERDAIKFRGKTVPMAVAVDYKDVLVDVTTPRDLMFDGFVIETEKDKRTRLPGIFMDVSSRFKIHPNAAESFVNRVRRTNIEFCASVEKSLNVSLPLGWFTGGDAMSHVTGHSLDTPMTHVMHGMKASNKISNVRELGVQIQSNGDVTPPTNAGNNNVHVLRPVALGMK